MTAEKKNMPQHGASDPPSPARLSSGDRHWPLKLRLTPLDAPFLQNARLVLVADCAPLAAPSFPARHLPGKAALLLCPKLEDKDSLVDRLAHMLRQCKIQSLTLARMEVPCCCIPELLRRALEQASDEDGGNALAGIPVDTVVLTRFGQEKM